jgi:biopolymer transport protein ExbD
MPLRTHIDQEPTLNLTAMLDVMFLLIIFFMLGTKFVEEEERSFAVNVPAVGDARSLSVKPAPRKIVHVDRLGNITLGNGREQSPVTLEQLAAELSAAAKQNQETGVLVRSDADNRLQSVAEVLGACKQAGIRDLNLAVRAAQSQKK